MTSLFIWLRTDVLANDLVIRLLLFFNNAFKRRSADALYAALFEGGAFKKTGRDMEILHDFKTGCGTGNYFSIDINTQGNKRKVIRHRHRQVKTKMFLFQYRPLD